MSFKLETFKEQRIDVAAGVAKIVDFDRYNPNVFLIRNISSADIYLSESPDVSTTNYYKKILANTSTKYISITGLSKLYLYCASSVTNIIFQSIYQDDLSSDDLDEDTSISAAISGISLGSVKILDTGGTNELAIDASGYIGINLQNSIPAGSNVIGNVGLETGSNTIGNVGLTTGSNVVGLFKIVDTGGTNELAIDGSGYIGVNLQNSIPAGSNIIGNVGINGSIPAGSNIIGNIGINGSIPAGTNKIGEIGLKDSGGHELDIQADGSINVNFTGTVSATTVQIKDETDTYFLNIDSSGYLTAKLSGSIPAGSNDIGTVSLSAPIPAGTNNIGDIDVLTIASGQNVKPSTSPVIYNVTCAVAGTEYSQALPANCKSFTIGMKSKNDSATWVIKFGTGGTEFSFAGNESLTIDNILYSSQTIYFDSDVAGEVIQIIANS